MKIAVVLLWMALVVMHVMVAEGKGDKIGETCTDNANCTGVAHSACKPDPACAKDKKCQCDAGYKANDDNTQCIPLCDPTCKNCSQAGPHGCTSCYYPAELTGYAPASCVDPLSVYADKLRLVGKISLPVELGYFRCSALAIMSEYVYVVGPIYKGGKYVRSYSLKTRLFVRKIFTCESLDYYDLQSHPATNRLFFKCGQNIGIMQLPEGSVSQLELDCGGDFTFSVAFNGHLVVQCAFRTILEYNTDYVLLRKIQLADINDCPMYKSSETLLPFMFPNGLFAIGAWCLVDSEGRIVKTRKRSDGWERATAHYNVLITIKGALIVNTSDLERSKEISISVNYPEYYALAVDESGGVLVIGGETSDVLQIFEMYK